MTTFETPDHVTIYIKDWTPRNSQAPDRIKPITGEKESARSAIFVAGRSGKKPIKTVVLHQNSFVEAGLFCALGRQPGIALVDRMAFIAGDFDIGSCEADVIVADYNRGLQLLVQMQNLSLPSNSLVPRILVLTDRNSESEIRHALRLGARGYLTLDCGFDELGNAVRALHRGARHIGALAASKLAESVAYELLTGRELDVLRLLVEGHPNKAIARHLNIAPGTVKSHMKALFQKLGARSRTHVVTVAERRGLVERGIYAAER